MLCKPPLKCLKIVIMANLLTMFFVMEMIIVSGLSFGASGLNMNYYLLSCPFVEPVVKNTVNRALQDDPTLAAGLVRMHFHDCFIEVHSLSSLSFPNTNNHSLTLTRNYYMIQNYHDVRQSLYISHII